jgi:hypothetical protein
MTTAAPTNVPVYQVDPFWPKPLPNNWILGQVSGIAVDERDHVWIVQRPGSLTEREAGAAQNPPLSESGMPAPPVIEFDPEGNVVQAFGGQATAREAEPWPRSEHGIYIDPDGNVWLASMDQIVMKYAPNGKRLLTIGERGDPEGSNDPRRFGFPTDIAVDPDAGEAFISDGYRNRRIIVVDKTTGAFKRLWGAYGEKPDDVELQPYEPGETPIRHFRSPMHAVRLGNDGLLYAADRVNNRIQVFQKSGEFVKEAFMATWTRAMGSVWDLDFSKDPQQTFLFIPDGTNCKVWILLRETLEVVGSFGRGGRQAGQFDWVHNLALDSKSNIFTAEVNTGKRVQKFLPMKQ